MWVYSLFTDKPGDYVKKPMRECTGKEICMEWLYHIGVPEDQIEELAAHSANTVPVMMPYIDAFFMPRADGRPARGSAGGRGELRLPGPVRRNAAGIPSSPPNIPCAPAWRRSTRLLNIDRGVPEVWGSVYDIRDLLNATVQLRDGKKITEMDANLLEKLAFKVLMSKSSGTDIEKLLKEYKLV